MTDHMPRMTTADTPEDRDRRALLTCAGASLIALGMTSLLPTQTKAQTMTDTWDKTFAKSDAVTHR